MWNDVEPIVYNTWDVLTMWMPPGPFLPLTMLSVLERNMYLEIYFYYIQLLDTTSLPYFGVKLSCVCLMFAYKKKIMTYSDPVVTHNYLKVTYSYPKVTYSDLQ